MATRVYVMLDLLNRVWSYGATPEEAAESFAKKGGKLYDDYNALTILSDEPFPDAIMVVPLPARRINRPRQR